MCSRRVLLLLTGALYLLLATLSGQAARREAAESLQRALRAAKQSAGPVERLTRKPPMGYNDWNAVHCNVTEGLIKRTAWAMVARGLAAAGYRYVNIDDCWSARTRDVQGRLQADPERFPRGIRSLAHYIHSFGLKLGIYADAGTATCAGYPGSYGRETQDAKTLASWGIDYLKEDWCAIPYGHFPLYTREGVGELLAARMARALHATGRPIVLSLSNAGDPTLQMERWGPSVAQLWRTTGDIVDTWSSVLGIVDVNTRAAAVAGRGRWNDPDMLEIGNGGMTPAEDRAQFSLWSIMAAPLIVGTNLSAGSPTTLAILTNRDVIAVDQDALAVQGTVVVRSGNREVLIKPLANGDRAVVLLNRGAPRTTVRAPAVRLGLQVHRRYTVRDLWTGRRFVMAGELTAVVPARSAVMLRIH